VQATIDGIGEVVTEILDQRKSAGSQKTRPLQP